LKNDFISYVLDKEKLELSMLNAEVYKIKENRIPLDLDKLSSNNSVN
jgi:hypothetical protein